MTSELKENEENRRPKDTVPEAPEQDDGWEVNSANDDLGKAAAPEAQRREPIASNELGDNGEGRWPQDTVAKEHAPRQDDGWEDSSADGQQGEMKKDSGVQPPGSSADSGNSLVVDHRANPAAGDKADDHLPTSRDNASSFDRPEWPDEDSVRITSDRATHILDGDGNGIGGGHRAGTGSPGKTEFPPSWDDDKILSNVEDVARNPDARPEEPQANGRWKFEGTRDSVHTTVIVNQDGTVHTAWPREGDPGVARNPEEG